MNRVPDLRTVSDRALDIAGEIEQFAGFDLATRRFIAHALWQVPDLRPIISNERPSSGNRPLPFDVSADEATQRAQAYRQIIVLRSCTGKGSEGQRQRRLHFGALLEPAMVDVKWKRLTTLAAFQFCYERLVGPSWRQLLPLAWQETARNRRNKALPRQLPLDARLKDDASVPRLLENDPAPWFFPSLVDAEEIEGAPLLGLL